MKKGTPIKLTFALLAIIFLSAKTFSQDWISINTGITDVISSVTYLDENTLYASCMDGNIYISSDGGLSWSVSYTGSTGIPMQTITSFNGNKIISAGYDGAILLYDGSSWQSIQTGTTLSLTGTSFADSNTGFVVGESGTILKSTDGGQTWSDIGFRFSQWIMAVYAYDSDHVMAVTALGTLLITSDGGLTWSQQIVPGMPWLGGIFMTAPNLAWLCGTNGTMYYYNGTSLVLYSLATSAGFAAIAMVNILTNYWHGYAVGDYGNIMSFNSGEWAVVTSPSSSMLWWIAMFMHNLTDNPLVSDSVSISSCAVGEDGTVLINNSIITGLKDPPPAKKSSVVYPNPNNSGICFVKGQIPADGIKITVSDISGNIVFESTINYPLTPIDLRNLSNGVYIVRIKKGDRLFVEKLILEK